MKIEPLAPAWATRPTTRLAAPGAPVARPRDAYMPTPKAPDLLPRVTGAHAELGSTLASAALHDLAAGVLGAGLGFLVGGPVGMAVGASVGTVLGQLFLQAVLTMADGSNGRHRLAALVPGALATALGAVGGAMAGATGLACGVLAAPVLLLAGYGLWRLITR